MNVALKFETFSFIFTSVTWNALVVVVGGDVQHRIVYFVYLAF